MVIQFGLDTSATDSDYHLFSEPLQKPVPSLRMRLIYLDITAHNVYYVKYKIWIDLNPGSPAAV